MPRSSSWSSGLLVALALSCALSSPARARRGGQFRQHYEQALRLYEQQRFEESIQAFQQAYAIQQLPRLLYNIGRAHFQLGHAKEAIESLERFLQLEPRPPPDIKAKVEDNLAQARAMLEAAERLARKEADKAPEPAPEPQREAPAEAAPEPAPAQPPVERPAPPVVQVAQAPPVQGVQAPVPVTRPAPPGRPRWRLALGASAAGAGLVLVGLGAGAAAVDGRCGAEPVAPALECDQVLRSLAPGAAMIGVGAALVVTGTILLAWPPRRIPARAE